MVARGGADGTDIGSERRPVRDRKRCFSAKEIPGDAAASASSALFQMTAPYRASPLTCRPAASNCMISLARLRSPFRFVMREHSFDVAAIPGGNPGFGKRHHRLKGHMHHMSPRWSVGCIARPKPKSGHYDLLKRLPVQTSVGETQSFAGPSRCGGASYTPGPRK